MCAPGYRLNWTICLPRLSLVLLPIPAVNCDTLWRLKHSMLGMPMRLLPSCRYLQSGGWSSKSSFLVQPAAWSETVWEGLFTPASWNLLKINLPSPKVSQDFNGRVVQRQKVAGWRSTVPHFIPFSISWRLAISGPKIHGGVAIPNRQLPTITRTCCAGSIWKWWEKRHWQIVKDIRCEAWFHEYLSEWGWMTLFLHAVAGN